MLHLKPLSRVSKDGKSAAGVPVALVENASATPSGILVLDCEGFSADGQELVELDPESGLTFQILPEKRENQRDVIFIVGASGSGKSTFAGNYMRVFQECFKTPASNILVVSADDFADPAFKGVDYTHIKADMNLVDNPIELDELTREDKNGVIKPSLVVFDDFEGISNKKVRDAVDVMQQKILEIGRKRKIYCIFISHRAANGRSTRYILNELTAFVMYPKFTSGQNLSYCLKQHLNVPEGLRSCFKNDPSWGRWIYIKNSAPQFIVSPYRACMFDADEVALALKKRSIIDRKRANMEAVKALTNQPKASKLLAIRGKTINNYETKEKYIDKYSDDEESD